MRKFGLTLVVAVGAYWLGVWIADRWSERAPRRQIKTEVWPESSPLTETALEALRSMGA